MSDSNFTPSREPQVEMKAFRFWCQKALPLVYDDSLSYYELLCKVVNYLNNTRVDVSRLEKYVTHYFDDLDVQDEINNKLDKMAKDGTLLDASNAWNSNMYIAPKTGDTIIDISKTDVLNDFYSLYDSLGNEFEKITLANTSDASELPMYMYKRNANLKTFIPTYGDLTSRNACDPTLILISGIHGNERQSMLALYNFVQYMITSVNSYYRDNFNIIVVPCANPYGVKHNSRTNENEVNLNRNFISNWDNYVPEYDYDYKGKTPLSENETKALANLLKSHQGNYGCVVISCHDFRYAIQKTPSIMWVASEYTPLRQRLASTIAYVKRVYDNEYDLPKDYPADSFARFVHTNGLTPTLENYGRSLGLQDLLCETPTEFKKGERFNDITNKIANIIYPCVISMMCDFAYRTLQNNNIYNLIDIGATLDNTLNEIISLMPEGSTCTFYVQKEKTYKVKNDLPIFYNQQHGGIVTINKPYTSYNDATIIRYTITSKRNTVEYLAKTNIDGEVSGWFLISPMTINGHTQLLAMLEDSNNITFENIAKCVKGGECFNVYTSSSYLTNLWDKLPENIKALTNAGFAIKIEAFASGSSNIITIFTLTSVGTNYNTIKCVYNYNPNSGNLYKRGFTKIETSNIE